MEITISNDFGKPISFSLEPEGTLIELDVDMSLTIDLLATDNGPILDLTIGKLNSEICIAIWPKNGNYSIADKYY